MHVRFRSNHNYSEVWTNMSENYGNSDEQQNYGQEGGFGGQESDEGSSYGSEAGQGERGYGSESSDEGGFGGEQSQSQY